MRKKLSGIMLLVALLSFVLILPGCDVLLQMEGSAQVVLPVTADISSLEDIPAFDGSTAYVAVNGNNPLFVPEELVTEPVEDYSELDDLGRCGAAFAIVCQETLPTEERGSISQVKPTGWQTAKYDCVDGKYLYNRCHLIGYQLTAENANKENLITGTRYLNIQGMLPFENMVADYLKEEPDAHVAYRVTPVFMDDNLVADGVLMEGWSIEDEGDSICFCVYAYNAQPGIEIDYATGESWESGGSSTSNKEATYIANKNSMKFHDPSCDNATKISEKNRLEFTGSREDLISQGYKPCGLCKP